MTDENKLIKDSARGDHAARLLSDPLLTEAFDTLEKTYIERMIDSGVDEKDSYVRDRLHQAIHILRKVKKHLSVVVMGDGTLAKAELSDIEGKRKRAA